MVALKLRRVLRWLVLARSWKDLGIRVHGEDQGFSHPFEEVVLR